MLGKLIFLSFLITSFAHANTVTVTGKDAKFLYGWGAIDNELAPNESIGMGSCLYNKENGKSKLVLCDIPSGEGGTITEPKQMNELLQKHFKPRTAAGDVAEQGIAYGFVCAKSGASHSCKLRELKNSGMMCNDPLGHGQIVEFSGDAEKACIKNGLSDYPCNPSSVDVKKGSVEKTSDGNITTIEYACGKASDKFKLKCKGSLVGKLKECVENRIEAKIESDSPSNEPKSVSSQAKSKAKAAQ